MRFCVCPLKGRRCSLVGHVYSMLLYRHRVSTEFWDSSEVKAILRPSCQVLCRYYSPPQSLPSHTQSRDLYVGLTGNPDSWDTSKTNMNDPQGRISSDRRWMDGQTDGFTDPTARKSPLPPTQHPLLICCRAVRLWLPNKQPLTVSGFVLSQQPLDAEFWATVKAEKAHATGRQPKWHKVYPHQASGGRCINKTDAPLPCLKPANMKRVILEP